MSLHPRFGPRRTRARLAAAATHLAAASTQHVRMPVKINGRHTTVCGTCTTALRPLTGRVVGWPCLHAPDDTGAVRLLSGFETAPDYADEQFAPRP